MMKNKGMRKATIVTLIVALLMTTGIVIHAGAFTAADELAYIAAIECELAHCEKGTEVFGGPPLDSINGGGLPCGVCRPNVWGFWPSCCSGVQFNLCGTRYVGFRCNC